MISWTVLKTSFIDRGVTKDALKHNIIFQNPPVPSHEKTTVELWRLQTFDICFIGFFKKGGNNKIPQILPVKQKAKMYKLSSP